MKTDDMVSDKVSESEMVSGSVSDNVVNMNLMSDVSGSDCTRVGNTCTQHHCKMTRVVTKVGEEYSLRLVL